MLLPPGRFSYSSDEYLFHECPGCGKIDHFYWNVVKCVGKCFVCDHIIVGSFQMERETQGLGEYTWNPPLGNNHQYLKERGNLHYSSAWENSEAREFLEKRNISERLCKTVPINYSPESNVMSVQVDSISPEFEPYSIYRTPTEDSFWRLPKKVKSGYYGFNIRNMNPDFGLVIFEGVFDVLSSGLHPIGIALCGSSMNNAWCIWLSKFPKVAIWMDPDEAGEKGAASISEKLEQWEIPHKIIRSEKEPKKHRLDNINDYEIYKEIMQFLLTKQ